jgi:hypothetical protein
MAIASCVANMRGIEKGLIWDAVEPSGQDGKYQCVYWGPQLVSPGPPCKFNGNTFSDDRNTFFQHRKSP